jgi:Protein of unknown function (DUF2846)
MGEGMEQTALRTEKRRFLAGIFTERLGSYNFIQSGRFSDYGKTLFATGVLEAAIAGCKRPETPEWRRAVKIVVIVMLFATSALAQVVGPASPTAACGSENVSFKVKLDESQHTLVQPDPGKARIYFIHDAGTSNTLGYPTVKVAIDGAWVGAHHGNSYFSVSVEPGEHHACVTLQSSLVAQRVELAHFTAEAGKIYYYRTQLVTSRSVELLELDPIDSDQGKYLVASFGLSISSPKK